MRKVGLNYTNSKQAVKYLNKLLTAADTAQKRGKYLALDKVLTEAKKLSDLIHETEANPFKNAIPHANTKAISELQWLKYQSARKVPPSYNQAYKKVTGVIVE